MQILKLLDRLYFPHQCHRVPTELESLERSECLEKIGQFSWWRRKWHVVHAVQGMLFLDFRPEHDRCFVTWYSLANKLVTWNTFVSHR